MKFISFPLKETALKAFVSKIFRFKFTFDKINFVLTYGLSEEKSISAKILKSVKILMNSPRTIDSETFPM